MSQEIEIEFKTLLTKTAFERLHRSLPFPDTAVKQTNYYFETKNFDLKTNRSALRIREKNGGYTLTLKQPHPQGILETHDTLTKEEFTEWMQGRTIGKEHTSKQLRKINIPVNDIHYYGALKTKRYSYMDNDIIYVLDKSFYHDIIDYELEIEAPNYASGKKAFAQLLDQFQITKQAPITKIERFFTSLGKN